MTEQQWKRIAYLMVNGWPGRFGADNAAAYYAFLRDHDARQVEQAVRSLARQGARFVPSVGEIEEEIGAAAKAARPTWDEAWALIYRAQNSLATLRDWGAHPYVLAWVESYGVERLCLEPVNDPDHGGAVVKRLGESYATFCVAAETRERNGYELTAGPRRGELRQLGDMRELVEGDDG